jgi:thioester reductase-like protein
VSTILVTGATGVIGSALTECLLRDQHVRLRLLIRAQSSEHLQQRLAGLLAFCGVSAKDHATAARVEAVAGDVTADGLGLGRETYERLTTEVTHVIHSAGNVKLNRPMDEARRSAVQSTEHVVRFVSACVDRGRFRKLDFVSTVGVAGDIAGVIPEQAFTRPRAFRNTYEAAKAEAEDTLFEAMDRGLPATVHRPSMVVGDSRNGRVSHFQVFYHLCEFLSGRRTRGVLTDAGEVRLDVVPVDYVARALRYSSARPEAGGRIFHLCSGPALAPRINDLARRVRDLFVAHGRPCPTPRMVAPTTMRAVASLAGRILPGGTAALRSLPYFLAYLETPQTFDNARSEAFFSAEGLRVPSVHDYLETVLSFYLSHCAAQAGASDARGVA